MENKYGYKIENNKEELEQELKQATEKYGNQLLILNHVEVASVEDLVNDNNFQFFVGDEQDDLTITHVYVVRNATMWYGYLTGLLLEWYTDEDFESGLFGGYETTKHEMVETIEKLEALNNFMAEYQDRNWDIEKSKKRVSELKKDLK